MNDALCEIYWVGPKKHNIGMGYICEGDVESERFVQSLQWVLINQFSRFRFSIPENHKSIFVFSSDESGVRGLGDMIGGVDLIDPEVSFPTHIMSNVFRSNKKVNYCLELLAHCLITVHQNNNLSLKSYNLKYDSKTRYIIKLIHTLLDKQCLA